MADSKIEQVARAIDPMSAKVADMLLERGVQRKDATAILPMDKARAAIEAMREPTEVMMAAINEHAGSIAPEYAYSDAIDAALAEDD